MSRYSDFHDIRVRNWPLCNGGNLRARPIDVSSKNEIHPPVRMHNLLLSHFKCPICKRETHGTMFQGPHR